MLDNFNKNFKPKTPLSFGEKVKNYFQEKAHDILFIQKRVGKGGEIIKVPKIRTMIHGADDNIPQEIINGNKITFEDPRIIPSRKWMRRGFDELPQLSLILLRKMAFIGSRPTSTCFHNSLEKKHKKLKEKYLPGLIGISYAHISKKRNSRKTDFLLLSLYDRKRKQSKVKAEVFKIILGTKAVYNAFIKGANK